MRRLVSSWSSRRDRPAEAGDRRLLPRLRRGRRTAGRAHAAAVSRAAGSRDRGRSGRTPRSAACARGIRGGRARSAGAGRRPQSRRGTSFIRSRSIFTGSSCRVRPSRCERRRTCVSTTTPCGLPQLGRDDVCRLAGDAREADELVEASGHLAVELLDQHLHRPAQRLRLLAEEPRRRGCRARAPRPAPRGSPRAGGTSGRASP